MGGSPKEAFPVVAKSRRRSLIRFVTPLKSAAVFSKSPLRFQEEQPNFCDDPISDDSSRCLTVEDGGEALETASTSTTTLAKSVRFGCVEVRDYSIVIGDHPYCTMGCPLSLGWEYSEARQITVDEYEASRPPRRDRQSLRTTWDERRKMLSDFSDVEVRRAQRRQYRGRSCRDIAADSAGFFTERSLA
jgi:hypothetical protein